MSSGEEKVSRASAPFRCPIEMIIVNGENIVKWSVAGHFIITRTSGHVLEWEFVGLRDLPWPAMGNVWSSRSTAGRLAFEVIAE